MMKNKILGLLILTLVLSAGIVSACCTEEDTIVKGLIYQDTESNPIAEANVQVTCTHNGINTVKNTISNSTGYYEVIYYNPNRCDFGDELNVVAYKAGIGTGTENGEINETDYEYYLNPSGSPIKYGCKLLNVGIVDVPLVPEFGLIVGLTTILGAVGFFLYVRKK